MALLLIVLVSSVLIGVLIGCRLSECLFDVRTRRQAAAQRSLNGQWQLIASQWQELKTAQRDGGQRRELEPWQSATR